MLTTVAHVAGYMDQEHSLNAIVQTVQDTVKINLPLVGKAYKLLYITV